jgi:biopolymer transport protein ExbD
MQRLQDAAGQAVQPEIHIRPTKRRKYDAVAGVLAASQRLRLDKIGVVGAEQFAN